MISNQIKSKADPDNSDLPSRSQLLISVGKKGAGVPPNVSISSGGLGAVGQPLLLSPPSPSSSSQGIRSPLDLAMTGLKSGGGTNSDLPPFPPEPEEEEEEEEAETGATAPGRIMPIRLEKKLETPSACARFP